MDLKLVWIATQRHPIGRPDSGFTGATPFPANGDGWITRRTPPRARFFCPGIESTPLPPGNRHPGGDESIGGCPETSRKMAPPFPTAFGETTPGSRSLANSFELSLQFRQIHSSSKLEIFFSGKNRPPYFSLLFPISLPSLISFFLSFFILFVSIYFIIYLFIIYISFFLNMQLQVYSPRSRRIFIRDGINFLDRNELGGEKMVSKMESITERKKLDQRCPSSMERGRQRFPFFAIVSPDDCCASTTPPPHHPTRGVSSTPSSPRGHDPLLIRGAQSSEALSNYIYSLLGRKLPAPRGGKN